MAIVRKRKAKVEKILNPLPSIYTVIFSSEKKFKYLPGQFLHLALDAYDGIGQWPESRCFSMQSNPSEKNIVITFSVVGRFTERMANELEPGKEIWLKLPYGDFFQRGHDINNCVFVAGGTGVTPFLSLVTDISFKEYSNPVLYLGFKDRQHNIFEEELKKASNINFQFSIKVKYENQSGMLNIEDIYNENRAKTYFISGPPNMINKFRSYLVENNVREDAVITDDWV